MCRKFFLLTLWALLPFGVWGNTRFPMSFHSEPSSKSEVVCDLDAPTNFQVLAIGATWVQLAWVPSVFGVDHVVKTFRSSDGVLVHQITITPAMAATVVVNGLQSGETYFSTICAVCPDGTESIKFVGTPDWDTIITELIVAGLTESCGGSTCGIRNAGEYCEFNLDGSLNHFRIQKKDGTQARQFNVQKLTIGGVPRLRCSVSGNMAPYNFYLDDQPASPQGVLGEVYKAKIATNTVAQFALHENYSSNPSVGHLVWTTGNTGYEILRLSYLPCGGGRDALSDSSDETKTSLNETKTGSFALVSPNPFLDHLDVYLTRLSANAVHLELFNVAGQKVLDQQYAGGQDQYHLPTAALANGFYLLRVEADGRVQTLKVIKSE